MISRRPPAAGERHYGLVTDKLSKISRLPGIQGEDEELRVVVRRWFLRRVHLCCACRGLLLTGCRWSPRPRPLAGGFSGITGIQRAL